MTKTVGCIERLQAVVDKQATQGAEPAFIVAALAEVTIKAAQNDGSHAVIHLEGAADVLSATLRAFEVELKLLLITFSDDHVSGWLCALPDRIGQSS